MLNAIKQFFDNNLKARPAGQPGIDHRQLQLATAALLIEMMRTDYQIKEPERQAVLNAIQAKFGLSAAETAKLVQLAETEAHNATDYHQFTSLINQGFSAEEKEKVVECLWQVAYADGDLDKYEEHLARKIAELLYIPHSVFIAAKHRVLAQGG